MASRARRNHSVRSRRRWPWRRSVTRRHWRSLRSISTFTRARSALHGRSFWTARRGVRGRLERSGGGGRERASRRVRSADAGERFFVRRARQGRHDERKAMIDREHGLALRRQAELLGLGRSGPYYRPRQMPAGDSAVMPERTDAGPGLLRRLAAICGRMKMTTVCGPRSSRARPSLRGARKRRSTTEPAGDPLIRRRNLSERPRPPVTAPPPRPETPIRG